MDVVVSSWLTVVGYTRERTAKLEACKIKMCSRPVSFHVFIEGGFLRPVVSTTDRYNKRLFQGYGLQPCVTMKGADLKNYYGLFSRLKEV